MHALSPNHIRLSDHFTFGKLFRFVMPTVLMMLFTSMYGVVDGLFVSQYSGKEAFAAITLIVPLPLLMGAVAYMIGAGGSAVIAQSLAAGKKEEANGYFTFLTLISILGSLVLVALGEVLIVPCAKLMGANDELLPYCEQYGRILISALPFYVLQNVFQSFLTVAERPMIGLAINLFSAFLNMGLNFVFIHFAGHVVTAVALATVVSQLIGGVMPFLFFTAKQHRALQYARPKMSKKVIGQVFANGVSEFVSEIFHPLASVMYNYKLMELAGINGVAAYGVLMNVGFLFGAVFLGFAVGSAPIFSYKYEKKEKEELHSLFRLSAITVVVMGFILYGIAVMIEGPFAAVFFGSDELLLTMTEEGFALHSKSYMVMGLAVFASAFFTSLHDSKSSALIAFLRTLLFEVLAIIILPMFFDLNGVWAASLTSEILSLFVTIFLLTKKRKEYGY